jgi:hypothetical protein
MCCKPLCSSKMLPRLVLVIAGAFQPPVLSTSPVWYRRKQKRAEPQFGRSASARSYSMRCDPRICWRRNTRHGRVGILQKNFAAFPGNRTASLPNAQSSSLAPWLPSGARIWRLWSCRRLLGSTGGARWFRLAAMIRVFPPQHCEQDVMHPGVFVCALDSNSLVQLGRNPERNFFDISHGGSSSVWRFTASMRLIRPQGRLAVKASGRPNVSVQHLTAKIAARLTASGA